MVLERREVDKATFYTKSFVVSLELELELYFYLNTVNLSDKIIILKKLQSALIYINML